MEPEYVSVFRRSSESGQMAHFPARIEFDLREPWKRTLVYFYDDLGFAESFSTFDEAIRFARRKEYDNQQGAYEPSDRGCQHPEDREDFHSDG